MDKAYEHQGKGSKADMIQPSNHPCASVTKKMGPLGWEAEVRPPREQLIPFRLF